MYVFWEHEAAGGLSQHGKDTTRLFKSCIHKADKYALSKTACNLRIPKDSLVKRTELTSEVPKERPYCKRCFK